LRLVFERLSSLRPRLALRWAAAMLLLGGCQLLVDFDRDTIPEADAGDAGSEEDESSEDGEQDETEKESGIEEGKKAGEGSRKTQNGDE